MDNPQNPTASCRGDRDTRESRKSNSFTASDATRLEFTLRYDRNMRLMSIKYSEFGGTDSEWNLDTVKLRQVNLLVGRNATGKTRVIQIIGSLGRLLADKLNRPLVDGSFEAQFSDGASTFTYKLTFDNFIVTVEEFREGSEELLHRGGGGFGRIYAAEVDRSIRFEIAANKLAVVAKRDSFQHPFLDRLNSWGSALRLFEFGKELGQRNLAVTLKSDVDATDESDTTQIVRFFKKGKDDHGDAFVDTVRADMNSLGFDLEDITVRKPANLIVQGAPLGLGDFLGISVKERDLRAPIDQPFISQGMFRALSIIIQLNYNLLANAAATILIDDIGEGLDYERSFLLVKLLREKVLASQTQLIMSTNDRFIMNSVPLEDWCVLQRTGHNVIAYNYQNSADAFERFKRTGLSNFDLLTTNYIQEYNKRVLEDAENGHLRRGPDGEDICRGTNQGNGGEAPVPH
jgi:predicted ATPase